jgi:hypothetical protein
MMAIALTSRHHESPRSVCIYVKTPSLFFSRLLVLDRRLFEEDLDFLLSRDLLFSFLDWRYLRIIIARRRRLFVNKIPVNMMKEASRNKPPTIYFNLVTQDFLLPMYALVDHGLTLREFARPELLLRV